MRFEQMVCNEPELKSNSLTIVGGDGAIGRQLLVECEKKGVSMHASTRRVERVGGRHFFLDMAAYQPAEYLPVGSGPLLIVAAKTGFELCENDPTSAMVNIEAPVKLAKAALAAGRRVVFVSTSSVFGGDAPLCEEDGEMKPTAAYSRQKAEAERQLAGLPGWCGQGAVVRLTKVLAPGTSPLPAWREALDRGAPITPFSDMVFAPISIQFAARSLIRIAMSQHCGNFHLSGAADATYVEFARQYVRARGGDISLIMPTTSAEAGINLLFSRRFGTLGMIRTQRLTGIVPQELGEVVADLLLAEQSSAGAH